MYETASERKLKSGSTEPAFVRKKAQIIRVQVLIMIVIYSLLKDFSIGKTLQFISAIMKKGYVTENQQKKY